MVDLRSRKSDDGLEAKCLLPIIDKAGMQSKTQSQTYAPIKLYIGTRWVHVV